MATCPTSPNFEDDLPDIPTGVNTADVTEGCVDGNGIYDVFMKAHVDAISIEYGKQRIKGSEYSKVYLGGMQAAMQQAVVFALGKDKASAEAELARYAILKAKADIELTYAQICLVNHQIEEMIGKAKLAEIQGWVELAKIHDIPNLAAADSLVKLREAANHTTTGVNAIDGVFGAQITKSAAEVTLLGFKSDSEEAQTVENKAEDHSVIGKEKGVLQRQADGYLRDAEQKLAKIGGDAFSMIYSTMDGEADIPAKLKANGVNAFLTEAESNLKESKDNVPIPQYPGDGKES